MARRIRAKRSNGRRRSARRGGKRAGKSSKRFTKAVQRVIHKNVETKQAFNTTGDSLIMCNSGITAASDIFQILPNIYNGTGDNARIGDEIRGQKISVKGYLQLNVDTSLSQVNKRIAVRIMVVSTKRFSATNDAYNNFAGWYQSLLKKGGTQVAFSGTISDLMAPINTDEITKHYDKTFYMSQSNIFSYTAPGTASVAVVGLEEATDIRSTIKMFRFHIKCRNKLLRYDATHAGGTQPTNYGPMLLVGYTHLDGSAADVLQTNVGLHFDSVFDYEDA